MPDLNTLFRKRLGIPEQEHLTFESLENILVKAATSLPFENLCIIANEVRTITRDSLINKILINNEGGLCYELNPLLYYFLVDNDFDVNLVRCSVYNNETKNWSETGKTHIAILLHHDSETYVVDTGFGSSVPLKPVPLNGEVSSSMNGDFRVKPFDNEHGDYVVELRIKYKDPDWRIGYMFDSKPLEDLSEVNDVQDIIVHHEQSNFNKTPLITQVINEGSMTLTDSSFTQWIKGKQHKQQIDSKTYRQLAKQHFGLKEV